jgi:hypothetical protein
VFFESLIVAYGIFIWMNELTTYIIELLLIVEIILLGATIYLIIKSREEYRGRLLLLEKMRVAIDLLTRREYFDAVFDIYREARGWVVGTVTGSKPRDADRPLLDNLLNLLESKIRDGVNIRLVIPRSPDKLYMGYRYNSIGVDVKFHENLLIYDLRFTVADGRVVVMGFPIETGEAKPTRRGVKIYSETLAGILTRNFERYWLSKQAISYEDYLRLYVDGIIDTHPEVTLETVATQLEIPVEEIRRVMGK